MAAAPVLDDRGTPTSPELALVDASLAEELRAALPDAPSRFGERTAALAAPAELVAHPAPTWHTDLVVHPVVRELQAPPQTTPPEPELDDAVQIDQPGSCLDLIVAYDEAEVDGAGDGYTYGSVTANQPDVPPASEHVDEVVETSAPTSVADDDPSTCVDLIVGYDEPEVDCAGGEYTHVSDTADQPEVQPEAEHVDVVVETSAATNAADDGQSNCVDLIASYGDDEMPDAPAPASAYPSLPSPAPEDDASYETVAALQGIQQRLTTDNPNTGPARRRIRRGFTVASGLVAVAALTAYSAETYMGLVEGRMWVGLG